MKYVIGAIVGIVWGALCALLNALITKKMLAKGSASAMNGASALHMLVDLAALALVFFLRKILPFSFEATLIATAVALSLISIIITYQMSKKV